MLKNFIYIKPCKTGTTSIRRVLRPHCNNGHGVRVLPYSDVSGLYGHRPYSFYANFALNHEIDLSDIFFFMTVRNPWDRMVSWYEYCSRRVYKGPCKISSDTAFKDYVVSIYNGDIKLFEGMNPCYTLASGCMNCHIVRYENIRSDFEIVCSHLSIRKSRLPHTNKGYRNLYQSYYDDETRSMIQDIYASDIREYNYTFS